MQTDLLLFFTAHLEQLKAEINAYPNDESVWYVAEGIANSAGTICCHLAGNLNHFVGHGLGNTGYVRDRPLEFSVRDIPRNELVEMLDETGDMLSVVLPGIDLAAAYPTELFGTDCSVHQAMLRLLGHFNYHLGQVNYHRRLLT